jgi:hypothetical protein
LALSWLVRADFHVLGGRSGGELLDDLSEALNHIVLFPPEAGSAFMSPFLYPFVLLALLGALAFLDGWRGVVIGAWAVAVLVAAVILHGYWYYHVPLRVHRWLVVFPVLFALLAVFAGRLTTPPSWGRHLFAVALAVSIVTGALYHHDYVWTRPPLRQLALTRFLADRLPSGSVPGSVLLVTELMALDEETRDGYANHWQFLLYFLPTVDATAVVSEVEHCSQIREQVTEASRVPKFLLAVEGQRASRCFPTARLEPLARFRFASDPALALYRLVLPAERAR